MAILLDTNIVSELMRAQPDRRVLAWLAEQESAHLYISTITIAEITYGLSILPEGQKQQFPLNIKRLLDPL